jgi:hypothetical protein
MLTINIKIFRFLIVLFVALSSHSATPSSFLKFPILNANYLGCFNENQTYLSSYAFSRRNMNVKMCIDECKKRNYHYAGLVDV